jgi:hypothetical protein
MTMRITALSLAIAAGTTFAQTVVLTSNTTLNPGATTIGGVPLATRCGGRRRRGRAS